MVVTEYERERERSEGENKEASVWHDERAKNFSSVWNFKPKSCSKRDREQELLYCYVFSFIYLTSNILIILR